MKETAIIFDHDGTLIDSIDAVIKCTNTALEQTGHETCPYNEVKDGIAFSTLIRFSRHTGLNDKTELKKIAEIFYKIMHAEGLQYLKVYPGITEALDALTDAGFSMGMVSNNQGKFIRKAAARLQYSYDLEIILGEENVRAVKPAPDGLLQACAGLAAKPEKCWYIGDAESDYRSARAAGMKSGPRHLGPPL